MLRFAADQNFNNDIVRGLLRRNPALDVISLDSAGLARADDATVLAWAAREGRILLTHDVSTMTHYAYERVRLGQLMPGVFEVGPNVPIGSVIEDILLLAELGIPGDFEGQVRYLPLIE